MTRQCLDKNIVIRPAAGRVKVIFDGKVIANSTNALELDEPGSQLRTYIPRGDVLPEVLVPSQTTSVCPYKGEASYHSLKTAHVESRDAVWYYSDPCPLVEPIRDHLAFWGDAIRYEVEV